jgi:hypothetical protein
MYSKNNRKISLVSSMQPKQPARPEPQHGVHIRFYDDGTVVKVSDGPNHREERDPYAKRKSEDSGDRSLGYADKKRKYHKGCVNAASNSQVVYAHDTALNLPPIPTCVLPKEDHLSCKCYQISDVHEGSGAVRRIKGYSPYTHDDYPHLTLSPHLEWLRKVLSTRRRSTR